MNLEVIASRSTKKARSARWAELAPLHGTLNGIGFVLCGLLGWNVTAGRSVRSGRAGR